MRQMGIMYIWIIETYTNTLVLSLSFFTFYHGCQKYTHKIVMDYNCKAKKDWKLTRLKSTLSSSNQLSIGTPET